MKLSEAIEHQLVSGGYAKYHFYMCHALKLNGGKGHEEAVQQMVFDIQNNENQKYKNSTLYGALNSGRICPFNGIVSHKITTEFYVWWVFDLKRKGL